MTQQWIYWFDELNQGDNDLVGKKCANLGEMTKLGMRVPPGYAISVDGFQRYMEVTGLGERLERYFADLGPDLKTSVQKQMDASQAAKEMFAHTPMPDEVGGPIESNYATLCERTGIADVPVAVRSSGSVSMPGQMETYLYVRGAHDVKHRVREVWESTFNTRAIAFRLEKGLAVAKAPIGVAVLKMVDAKSAGVVLTVDPNSADLDHVVVEGNWGLGESVVSGEITPDHFLVAKADLGIVDRVVSRKTRQVIPTEHGTHKAEVPAELQDLPCLDDAEIGEIVRVALGVEKHFGAPQDMEWVIDRDANVPESVIWVQARPAKFVAKDKAAEADYLVDQMTRLFRH